jgi:hypothetical protein
MKIIAILFSYMRNEAHYQFLLLVQKLFISYPAVAAIVADLLSEFNVLLTLEGQLVDSVRSSEYTVELKAADKRLDRCIVGIVNAIISALHHFDPAVVNAARRLEILLKSFRSSIEKKSYEEESAAVKILIADLSGEYAPQVALLNLGPWLAELSAALDDFERIFLLRSNQRATKPKERLKDVRKQIEVIYRKIVERIDAYTVVNGETSTADFVNHLNDEVTYFNQHNHRHAKKDIAKANINSIPDQIYNDEPVIVLPEVFYEGDKLIFTKDYELSFRDNNSVGTASVSVRGKGAFKGVKTMSFNVIIDDERDV